MFQGFWCDDCIWVADGIPDCGNTVVRSQGQAAAAPQADIESAMDVSDDVVVVDRCAGHRDRLEAVELVTGALDLGPGEKLVSGHPRLA